MIPRPFSPRLALDALAGWLCIIACIAMAAVVLS